MIETSTSLSIVSRGNETTNIAIPIETALSPRPAKSRRNDVSPGAETKTIKFSSNDNIVLWNDHKYRASFGNLKQSRGHSLLFAKYTTVLNKTTVKRPSLPTLKSIVIDCKIFFGGRSRKSNESLAGVRRT